MFHSPGKRRSTSLCSSSIIPGSCAFSCITPISSSSSTIRELASRASYQRSGCPNDSRVSRIVFSLYQPPVVGLLLLLRAAALLVGLLLGISHLLLVNTNNQVAITEMNQRIGDLVVRVHK